MRLSLAQRTRGSNDAFDAHPRVLRLLLVSAVLTAMVLPATIAQANNRGSTKCSSDQNPRNRVRLGDNATHTWYPEGTLGNQLPGMDSAVQTAMNDYETVTDLTTTKTNNSTLDVLVTDYLYPDIGLLGWVECLPDLAYSGLHPLLRCDRQRLRFNSREGEAVPTGTQSTKRQSMGCREIGHTVGLRHPDSATGAPTNTCMGNSFNPSATIYPLTSSHDDAHVNQYH